MRVFLVLVIAVAHAASAPKNLPSSWPVCKKSDPSFEVCFQNAVQAAIVDLGSRGAKEFGIFPIDPLVISQVDIDQGSGPVSIELHFYDLHIYGLKMAKLGPVKADVDKYHFQAPAWVREGITLKGKYKVNGKVLVLPIQGQGDCELNIANVTAFINLHGKEMKKDNVKYMDVTDFKFTVDTTGLKMRFENLFNGNKQLSDQMNIFLNENWTEILKELKPAIQDAFGAAFTDISNRIFHKVPYNKIFL